MTTKNDDLRPHTIEDFLTQRRARELDTKAFYRGIYLRMMAGAAGTFALFGLAWIVSQIVKAYF